MDIDVFRLNVYQRQRIPATFYKSHKTSKGARQWRRSEQKWHAMCVALTSILSTLHNALYNPPSLVQVPPWFWPMVFFPYPPSFDKTMFKPCENDSHVYVHLKAFEPEEFRC